MFSNRTEIIIFIDFVLKISVALQIIAFAQVVLRIWNAQIFATEIVVTFTFLNHLKKAKKANKGDCTTAIIKKRIFRQISIFNIVMRYLNLSACNNVTLIIDYFREFFIFFFYFKLINIANTKHSSRLILENFLFYKKKKYLLVLRKWIFHSRFVARVYIEWKIFFFLFQFFFSSLYHIFFRKYCYNNMYVWLYRCARILQNP